MLNFFNGSEYEDLYEFSTSVLENPFGAELLRTSAEIYDDIDEAVDQLAAGLAARGVEADEEDIVGLMTGEYIPSAECLQALEDLFYDEDGTFHEEDYARLISSAEAAEDLAYRTAEELGMFDEEEDEDDEEEYEDEEDDEFVNSELEDLRSQLQAQQERQEVTDTLDELTEYASSLVQDGKLPPVAFSFMLGDKRSTSTSRYAEFSSFCQESELDAADQLGRISYALEIFSKCGPLMNFSQVSSEEVGQESYQSKEDDSIIRASFEAYKAGR